MEKEEKDDLTDVHPTIKDKLFIRIAYTALILIAVSISIFAYWAAQPTDVLVVKNLPLPIESTKDNPTAGGIVILDAKYCKNLNRKGSLRLSYVSDSREVFLPITQESSPVGCNEAQLPVVLPKDLVPDTYKIKFKVTYDVNPLKRGIVEQFESQSIKVV